MAFTHGTNAQLAIDVAGGTSYVDVSTYLEDVNQDTKTDKAETSTLGNTAKTYIPGLEDGTFKCKGFFDPTVDAIWNSARRVIVTFRYRPGGTGVGKVEYTGSAFLVNYQIDANVKDVVQGKVDFQITGPFARAVQV